MSLKVSAWIKLKVLMWGLLELRSSHSWKQNSLVTLFNSSATVKENGKTSNIIEILCSFNLILPFLSFIFSKPAFI